MGDPTATNSAPAAGAAQPAPSQTVPAASQPSLLGAEPPRAGAEPPVMPPAFQGGAEAWAKLEPAAQAQAVTAAADAAKAESKVRTDAFNAAQGKDARLAAYNALSKDEKADAFKGLNEEQRKELGIEDPAIPQYAKFNLPEGFAADDKALAEATELFKAARLPQEQAQKFIDLAVGRERAAVERGQRAYAELQSKWQGEVMADPEIGGDKWGASKAAFDRLIDRLNLPDLKGALNLTGAGNNPTIVRAFVRLGQMVSEDTLRSGPGPKNAEQRSAAERMYPGGPRQSADA